MTTFLSNWHFMRIMRAALAVWAIFEFSRTHDALILMLGGLFALQAIFDVGCCGASGCATPRSVGKQNSDVQNVEYEEIK